MGRAVAALRFPDFSDKMKLMWMVKSWGIFCGFAVASTVTHPIFVIVVMGLTCLAWQKIRMGETWPGLKYMYITAYTPTFWFTVPQSSSIYGFGPKCFTTYPFVIGTLVRTVIVIAMCCLLSLPQGLFGAPYDHSWTPMEIGRPMGPNVFLTHFIYPVGFLFTGTGGGGISTGTACFRTFLLLGCVIGMGAETVFNIYC